MRKALVIGINNYNNCPKLCGCVNDAKRMKDLFLFNDDETHNFDVKSLVDDEATKNDILSSIKNLYKNNDELSVLYFSGHGCDIKNDGSIVSVDGQIITFGEIMELVREANTKYNIIFLDCCFSGKIGSLMTIGDQTVLPENTVIFTACSPKEPALDDSESKHGTFTNLLIGALQGGASDILGRVTPGSVYSYIDQALGSWEQRPYFKANVSTFVSIRTTKSRITTSLLKKGMSLFADKDATYKLDPSYEETNIKGNKLNKVFKPYACKEHVETMKLLQKFNQLNLVIPEDQEYMYYAAMKSKDVKLTDLGKHYWGLCSKGRI